MSKFKRDCLYCGKYGGHYLIPLEERLERGYITYRSQQVCEQCHTQIECLSIEPHLPERERWCKTYDCDSRIVRYGDTPFYECSNCSKYYLPTLTTRGERYPAVVCPVCFGANMDGGVVDMHFHHWDYENDIGVTICENCHESIHGGTRVRHQEREARSIRYSGWEELALNNLVSLLNKFNNDIFEIEDKNAFLNIPENLFSD